MILQRFIVYVCVRVRVFVERVSSRVVGELEEKDKTLPFFLGRKKLMTELAKWRELKNYGALRRALKYKKKYSSIAVGNLQRREHRASMMMICR